jgi:hypothetical protein
LGHVRLELPIADKYDLEIHQMGVCTAFLGVDLEEEIYMHPPQGYFHLVQAGRSKTSWNMVLHLKKSLYGLKQFSHVLYGTFKDFVILIGFLTSRINGGLFVLDHMQHHRIVFAIVVLYIDDLLNIAIEGLIGQIKDQMKKRLQMHHLGSVTVDLRMNIERNREHHRIDIDWHRYIRTGEVQNE